MFNRSEKLINFLRLDKKKLYNYSLKSLSLIGAITLGSLVLCFGTISRVTAANLLTNGSFESTFTSYDHAGHDQYGTTFYYQPTGPNIAWTFGTNTGLSQSYSIFQAYDGNQFAFLQTATGLLSQTFSVNQDTNENLSFALALRPVYNAGQVVQVSLDGKALTSLPAISTSWTLETLELGLLSSGNHTIAFQGLSGNSGDTTAFIDDVSITPSLVPEPLNILGVGLSTIYLLGLGGTLKRNRVK